MDDNQGISWEESRMYVMNSIEEIKVGIQEIKTIVGGLKEFKAKMIGAAVVSSIIISGIVSGLVAWIR